VVPLPLRPSGVMFTAEFFWFGDFGWSEIDWISTSEIFCTKRFKAYCNVFFWSSIFLSSGKVMHSFCEKLVQNRYVLLKSGHV